MKVAIIADIHGNGVALEAVLKDVEAFIPDKLLCLGDVAAFGPQPKEVLTQLRRLDVPVVMGNTDAWLLAPPAFPAEQEQAQRNAQQLEWCLTQLDAGDLAYIRGFKKTIEVALGDQRTLLCYHGSPASYDDMLLPTTAESDLAASLADFGADVYAGGHTHLPMLRRHEGRTVLNPGSVGLPFDRLPSTRYLPYAEYAVVSAINESVSAEFRRVPFDVAAIAGVARRSGMPYAEAWIMKWQR